MNPGRESRGPKGKKDANGPAKARFGNYFTYHPSEAHRKHMLTLAPELGLIISWLMAHVQAGLVVTVKYNEDFQAYVATMRESRGDWKEQKAVSVWNGDGPRALLGLYYYLTEVNPDWPQTHPNPLQEEFDW